MSSAASKYPNLKPYKPGESGNPGGRLRGFNKVVKELLRKTELNGTPIPYGRTVEEALACTVLLRAIEGDNQCLIEILNRIYGKAGSIDVGDGRRVVFELIDNNRDRALDQPPVTDAPEVPGVVEGTEPKVSPSD